ncbi:MAG: HEAT repeat domain-containing protein [Planctomycetota bacterium]|nr:HEAT repeat domain-containing protein [Planctomycetota bacterium]
MLIQRYLTLAAAAAILTAASATGAFAQSNSKEILAKDAAALVAILKDANAPIFDKAKACQRLASIGTPDAIPALVALLPDEKLNLYARYGLEGIPDPAVDAALRAATKTLAGRPLVGVINSIGQRKDVGAVELLKGLLGNADSAVVSAAAGALGRIGTPEAVGILKDALAKDSKVKGCIADGCLAAAEVQAAGGKKSEALGLYGTVVQADVPDFVKAAALRGQFRLQGAEAKDLLLTQIRSKEEAFFNVGLAVAREMPGADVARALAGELEKLPPERQALLLLALGDRQEPAPMPLVLAATKSESAAVREAAVRVLAKFGDASAVAVLLGAALGGGTVADSAKEGLKSLAAGQEVDAAIAAKLTGADAKAKVVLFELVGVRRIMAAEPAIRAALADADESVKLTAIVALGQLIELKDFDLLTSRALAGANEKEIAAAQAALRTAAMRMGDRDGCAAKLAASLKTASAANREYLLELLGKVSGQKALEIVVGASQSDDAALKEAATKVLGEWVNADAAPALLDIAKTDKEAKYQVRALRGYIRIARQLQLPTETRFAMFRTAMEVARRDDEKKIALDILTRIPSPATLELAVSYLDQQKLKAAAADAAVKIAAKVSKNPKAVAAAMQKVVDAGVTGNPGARAKQLLDQAQAALK